MAIDIVFELIEKEQYNLSWSFILEYENEKNPFINRRDYIKSLSELCKSEIGPCEEIRNKAKEIMENSNVKSKDALHLACAVCNQVDYFISGLHATLQIKAQELWHNFKQDWISSPVYNSSENHHSS